MFPAWRVLFLGLFAALVVAAPVGAAASSQVGADETLAAAIVARINVIRHERGLPSVRVSRALSRAAGGHSTSMATYGFFAHESRDGTAFWRRIRQDYRQAGFRTWSVGETLAFASATLDAAQTVRMWMHSPPHRRVLLTAAWREIGVSAVRVTSAPGDFAGENVTLVTADFGIRR